MTPGDQVRTNDGRAGVVRELIEIPARKGRDAYPRALVAFGPAPDWPIGYVQFSDLDRLVLDAGPAQLDLFEPTTTKERA